MSNSRAGRRQLAAATRGGVILGRPTSYVSRVRNAQGQPLPCCYAGDGVNEEPCPRDGDTRFRISTKHEDGSGDNLVHIFCSDDHRRAFAKGTRYEQYVQ